MKADAGLRVSLDATAIPITAAGAGQYVLALARELSSRPDVDLTVVNRRDDPDRWREATRGDAVLVAEAPSFRPARLVWEQTRLPAVLHRGGIVVHHGPHYTLPRRARTATVATVHDCTFFDHPEWHERSKVLFFKHAIRVAARDANVIICDSTTTAERLQAVVEVRPPVIVAPLGVDHDRFRPTEPTPGSDRETLGRVGIDAARPLVVFVGTVEPRKGVGVLVDGFDLIAAEHPDAQLVIAGKRGWGPDDLGQAVARAGHPDQVRVLGYVPGEAIPALMRAARVVAFPSFAEGFGLPALEAMACGSPLVTTTGTAMAEFATGSASLVEPGDRRGLADVLETALSAAGPDPERLKIGFEIAAGHTWTRNADLHVAAYREAASR